MVAQLPDDNAEPGGQMAWAADGYWGESRQPLASLVFIAPLLVVYETGVLVFGPAAVRNGADAWLRQLLDWIGLGQYFLLPMLTVGLLLGWHHTTHRPWRLSRGLFRGMAAESLALAIVLWLLAWLQGSLLQTTAGSSRSGIMGTLENVVSYLGAGVYEELLFRLILLSLVASGLGLLGLSPRGRLPVAVLLTSLLFSAAHYVGPYGDSLALNSFLFRFLAGVFFSVLFVHRGFGIVAGAHAGYDILVGLFASA